MDQNDAILLQELDNLSNITAEQCSIESFNKNRPLINPLLSVVTQNIRSVHKTSNIDDLDINIATFNTTIDVIVLTECRINHDKPLPHRSNYITYNSTIQVNQNDGVVVFVKESLKHSAKEILLQGASCLEITFTNYSEEQKIICIYRPPGQKNPQKFIDSLDQYLQSLQPKTNVILTGDININIIDGNNDKYSDTYLDMLASHRLLPGHTFDTRINSCIDHIMINVNPTHYAASIAVLDTTITDHKMTVIYLYRKNKSYSAPKARLVTDYDEALKTLKLNLESGILKTQDPNILTNGLINSITDSLKNNTKLVKIPCSKRIIKPWITPGILKCIKNRNHLQRKLKADENNEILKITYRRYRNHCNKLIKNIKNQYERQLLNNSKSNNKSLWNCIKSITNLNKNKQKNIELLNLKSTASKSADYINHHFNNVGKLLAQEISINPQHLNTYLNNLTSQVNSIGIIEPDFLEVESIINNLKTDSAPGYDNIPTKFIKLAKNDLIPIITQICILCFQLGIFPDLLKCSIIHPVHKGGTKDDINNYRPISVLPVMSKILEKLINNRLIKYLNSYEILSKSQYGFRAGVSTEDAIRDLTNNVTKLIDNRKKALCIFLDIKKAFDTIYVPILLRKMEKIGIRGTFLKLITNYLQNRTQSVKICDGVLSSKEFISNYGIPQGSVLGPTLFLIYINDLTNICLPNGQVFSYADDTALLFHGNSWIETFTKAESGLHSVLKWLQLNSLSLNLSKTHYIPFSIRDSSQPNIDLKITAHTCDMNQPLSCICSEIERVSITKYLGILLDKHLSWYPQLDVVAKRARKLIWLFKRLRNVSDLGLIRYIYITLVQSILLYCISVWGGTFKTKFTSIERAQRKILKIMLCKSKFYSTEKLYQDIDLLTVRQLYILQCTLNVHKTKAVNPTILNKRNPYNIIKTQKVNTVLASKQFESQSIRLYNKINRSLNIYQMTLKECKNTITKWLKTLNYEQTEELLIKVQ